MLPGAVVPVTVTGEPVTADSSAGLVTVSGRRALGVGDVALVRALPAGRRGGPAPRSASEPDERRRRPGERRRRAGRLAVGEADRGGRRVGAERRRRRGRAAPSPARGSGRRREAKLAMPSSSDAAPAASPVCRACSPRSAESAGQRWPVPWPRRRPRAAVARAGRRSRRRCSGASPARSACRISIVASTTGSDARTSGSVGGQLAEPDELEEARRRSPSAGRASGRRCRRCRRSPRSGRRSSRGG